MKTRTQAPMILITSNSRSFHRGLFTFLVAIVAFWAMARSASAQMYVSTDGYGTIGEYAPDGTAINTDFVSGLNPGQVALSGTVLFVANGTPGTVGEYDAATGAAINANFITGLNIPNGVAVSGNVLFVASIGSNTVGEYNATTGAVINANLIPGLSSPNCLTVSGGDLFVSNYTSNGWVGEYDATTGAAINASLITGLYYPGGTAVSGTDLFVVVQGDDEVGEYNATTGAAINASFLTGLVNPANIAVFGGELFVTNQWSASVGEYDATTGATINGSFITNASLCNGIVFAATVTSYPPCTPVNLSPAGGATNVSWLANFQASPFSDPNSDDTQLASEWVVTQAADNAVIEDVIEDSAEMDLLSGIPLAASTDYTWQVRYEDNRGVWGAFSTPTGFTTGSFIYRPDAMIGFSVSRLVGLDVYSADGTGELIFTNAGRGYARMCPIFAQNSGNRTDTLLVHGSAHNAHFIVRYYYGTTDVTKSVTEGTFKLPNLRPDVRRGIRAIVEPRYLAARGEKFALQVTITSQSDPSASDTVLYDVTAR